MVKRRILFFLEKFKPATIRSWEFVANRMFLISMLLLASLVIPPRPLPPALGGSPSGGDVIDVAKIPTVFPDFSFRADSLIVAFDTNGHLIRINLLWEGQTPGLFYFSLPFKVSVKFLGGNGENRTAVTLIQPPTQSRNRVDWFLAVQDISHGIDLWLETPDIMSHSLWRDSLSLSFGLSFTPEIPSPTVDGSTYSPTLLFLQARTVAIDVCFPLEEFLDLESQPSPTNLFPGCFVSGSESGPLHGATWGFSPPGPQVFFYYTIELSLSTKAFLLPRTPPLFSTDLQQTVLVAASLLLGAHITLFVDKRKMHQPKSLSPYWVILTVLMVLALVEFV